MGQHESFRFRSLEDLRHKIDSLGLDIRLEEDLEPLSRRVSIGDLEVPNSLAIHPMEGCDGTLDGKPDLLTFRRYKRFARGGAGLLWFEATAVMPELRANPHQLCLTKQNMPDMEELLRRTQRVYEETFGPSHNPVMVLQVTHSGRYRRLHGSRVPVIAFHDKYLDQQLGISEDYPVISDEELEQLEDRFVEVARMAREIGFSAVDIKSCHRYLLSELLAAHTREGKYGGSFENRTRFLLNVIEKIQQQVAMDFQVAVRLNAYDGIPYPYGWGMSREDAEREDLSEVKRLLRLLYDKGVRMVNISAGNPYYNPHVGRPFDSPLTTRQLPAEHPLVGVARLFHAVRELQQEVPEMVIIGTGYSWLRQFLGYAAGANIRNGWTTMVGLGREALAYPDFARDLLGGYGLNPRKVCITCSRCSFLMSNGGPAGCVPFDREVYGPIYEQMRRPGES